MLELLTAGDIGDALQVRRAALGWTQEELAQRAGVSRQWLVKVESGHAGAELGKLLAVIRSLELAVVLTDRQPSMPDEIDLDHLLDASDATEGS